MMIIFYDCAYPFPFFGLGRVAPTSVLAGGGGAVRLDPLGFRRLGGAAVFAPVVSVSR